MENLSFWKEYFENYSLHRKNIFEFNILGLLLAFSSILSAIIPVGILFFLGGGIDTKLSSIFVATALLALFFTILGAHLNKESKGKYFLIQLSIISVLSLAIYLVVSLTEIISEQRRPAYIFLLFIPLILVLFISMTLTILTPRILPKQINSSLNLDNRKYSYFLMTFSMSFILMFIYIAFISELIKSGNLNISTPNFQENNRNLISSLLTVLSWGFLITYSADMLPKIRLFYTVKKYRLKKATPSNDPILEFLLDYDHNILDIVNKLEDSIKHGCLNLTEYYKLINILSLIFEKRCQSSIFIAHNYIEVSTLIHHTRVSNNQLFRFLIKETIDKEENIDYFCTVTTKN